MFAAALPPPCPLPAPSAKQVRISQAGRFHRITSLKVCGHTLARGATNGKYNPQGIRIGDASAAGHRVAWVEAHYQYPDPVPPFAVTDRASVAWVADGRLYATKGDDVLTLDAGTLGDLHAEGDAIVWTHDGVPRRVIP